VAVTKLRGQWQEDAAGRRVLVTLHPSALLRGDPAQRKAAWNAWISDLSAAASLFAPRRKKDEEKEKKSVRVEPAFAG